MLACLLLTHICTEERSFSVQIQHPNDSQIALTYYLLAQSSITALNEQTVKKLKKKKTQQKKPKKNPKKPYQGNRVKESHDSDLHNR